VTASFFCPFELIGWNGIDSRQGDQIGRIFASWLIVRFVQLYQKLQKHANFGGLLFRRKKLCINFDKNGLGYILGDFSQSHLVTLAASINKNLTSAKHLICT
jgi:hypothetical protein